MLIVSKTFSLSLLSVLTTYEASLLWSQVSFPINSYILVLMYIYATLQPTRLLAYLLKMLHLHFLRSMHSQDVTRWILLVTSRNNRSFFFFFAYKSFYTIEKVVLYRQLTKPKVVSLIRPALLKLFKSTANHAGHIWSQQALVPSISVPSVQD